MSLTLLAQGFFACSMSRAGGGGTCTYKFSPLDIKNRNQTLRDVRYTFEEIYFWRVDLLEKTWKNTSIFADISISIWAFIEKFVKVTEKYQL